MFGKFHRDHCTNCGIQDFYQERMISLAFIFYSSLGSFLLFIMKETIAVAV